MKTVALLCAFASGVSSRVQNNQSCISRNSVSCLDAATQIIFAIMFLYRASTQAGCRYFLSESFTLPVSVRWRAFSREIVNYRGRRFFHFVQWNIQRSLPNFSVDVNIYRSLIIDLAPFRHHFIERFLTQNHKAQFGINSRKTLYHLPLVPEVMNSCFLGSLSMMAFGKWKFVSKRYAGLAARTVLRLIS